MRRKSLPSGSAKRVFRKGAATHPANFAPPPMRGGYRK